MERTVHKPKISCSECRYSELVPGENAMLVRECRRRQPSVAYVPINAPGGPQFAHQSIWPRVHPSNHWCGEFAERAPD